MLHRSSPFRRRVAKGNVGTLCGAGDHKFDAAACDEMNGPAAPFAATHHDARLKRVPRRPDGTCWRIGPLAPGVARGRGTVPNSASKSGNLDPITRERIALAVTTCCDGCLCVHAKKVVPFGATRGKVAAALGGASALNAGKPFRCHSSCRL
ncbi:carboxymuconolactone decarboxylase family protein [Pandoraea sputorum]|uniref:carboxymuconolactone decarboxylase family protein n=1 Tax=Pandoraea sputorum TaxID=93222 RepID=UPI002966E6D3|nr:carboxymuconolactone decarboxylase family protein [Pandoraea sputorum]